MSDAVADRAHLSIGEVLALLQEEFPDVTISKIRFLESQGLLDPERTPSGYRKFYEADIDRLRWILTPAAGELPAAEGHQGPPRRGGDGAPPTTRRRRPPAAGRRRPPATPPAGEADRPAPIWMADAARVAAGRSAPELAARPRPPSAGRPAADGHGGRRGAARAARAARRRADVGEPHPGRAAARPAGLDRGRARASSSATACVAGAAWAPTSYYDGDALRRRPAGGRRSSRHGVEARHLRMYKIAAEREAGFFEQVVMPLLKQRNPEARQAGHRARWASWPSSGRRPAGRAPAASAARPPRSPDVAAGRPGHRCESLADRDELAAIVARLGADDRRRPPRRRRRSSACSRAACRFLADLVRQITVPGRASTSWPSRPTTPGTGRVRLVKDLDLDVAGRDVVLVEDIVDTGLTARRTCSASSAPRQPASRRGVRPGRQAGAGASCPSPVDFVGFEVPDAFVLGYGLDFAGRYRNLHGLWAADARRPGGRPGPLRRASSTAPDRLGSATCVAGAGGRVPTVVEMELVGVRVELPSQHARSSLLREADGDRRVLPIFIGAPEATAIAFALEEVVDPPADDPRPDARPARRPRA